MNTLFKWLSLDHRSLAKQRLFWIFVIGPTIISVLLLSVWFSYPWDLSPDGYSYFFEKSKLPFGILAAGVAGAAFIASIHRSIQTEKQIEESSKKSNFDIYSSHRKEFLEAAKSLKLKNGIKIYNELYPNSIKILSVVDTNEEFIKNTNKKISETNDLIKSLIKAIHTGINKTDIFSRGDINYKSNLNKAIKECNTEIRKINNKTKEIEEVTEEILIKEIKNNGADFKNIADEKNKEIDYFIKSINDKIKIINSATNADIKLLTK